MADAALTAPTEARLAAAPGPAFSTAPNTALAAATGRRRVASRLPRFVLSAATLALAAAGCGDRAGARGGGADGAAAARPAPPPRPVRDSSGIFVVLRGGDTLAVERFVRTAERIEGEVRDTAGSRLAYTAILGPRGGIGRLEVAWYLPGRHAAGPSQRQTAVVHGDTLVLRIGRRAGGEERRIHVAPGTQPYILASVAMAEQLLRRARAAGADTMRTPLYVIGLGYRLFPVIRRLGRDSARFEVSGNRLPLSLDGAGQIVAGGDVLLDIRVERLDSLGGERRRRADGARGPEAAAR